MKYLGHSEGHAQWAVRVALLLLLVFSAAPTQTSYPNASIAGERGRVCFESSQGIPRITTAIGLHPSLPSYQSLARDHSRAAMGASFDSRVSAVDLAVVSNHQGSLGSTCPSAGLSTATICGVGYVEQLAILLNNSAAETADELPADLRQGLQPGKPGGPPSVPLLLFYRRDWWSALLSAAGGTGNASSEGRDPALFAGAQADDLMGTAPAALLPRTWPQLVSLAAALLNRDLDGDGRADHVLCLDLSRGCKGWAILSAIHAPRVQTNGTAAGLWLDPASMELKLGGPALRTSLQLYAALAALNAAPFNPSGASASVSPGGLNLSLGLDLSRSTVAVEADELAAGGGEADSASGSPLCGGVNPLFAAGRCLFTLDWATAALRITRQGAPEVSGKVGAAQLPGAAWDEGAVESKSADAGVPPADPLPGAPSVGGTPPQWPPLNRAPFVGEAAAVWLLAANQSLLNKTRAGEFIRHVGLELDFKYGVLAGQDLELDTCAASDGAASPLPFCNPAVDSLGQGMLQSTLRGSTSPRTAAGSATCAGGSRSSLLLPAEAAVLAAAVAAGSEGGYASFDDPRVAAVAELLQMDPRDVQRVTQATRQALADPNVALDVMMPNSSAFRRGLDDLAYATLQAAARGLQTDVQAAVAPPTLGGPARQSTAETPEAMAGRRLLAFPSPEADDESSGPLAAAAAAVRVWRRTWETDGRGGESPLDAVMVSLGLDLQGDMLAGLIAEAEQQLNGSLGDFPHRPLLRRIYQAYVGFPERASPPLPPPRHPRKANPAVRIGLPVIVVSVCTGLLAALVTVVTVTRRQMAQMRAAMWLRLAAKPPGAGPATTLALTDVQNSTLLWEVLSAEVMDACLAIHHRIMRQSIAAHGGYEAFTEGDAFAVAFHSPEDALGFALEVQVALLDADWPPQLLEQPDASEVWVVHHHSAGQGTGSAPPGGHHLPVNPAAPHLSGAPSQSGTWGRSSALSTSVVLPSDASAAAAGSGYPIPPPGHGRHVHLSAHPHASWRPSPQPGPLGYPPSAIDQASNPARPHVLTTGLSGRRRFLRWHSEPRARAESAASAALASVGAIPEDPDDPQPSSLHQPRPEAPPLHDGRVTAPERRGVPHPPLGPHLGVRAFTTSGAIGPLPQLSSTADTLLRVYLRMDHPHQAAAPALAVTAITRLPSDSSDAAAAASTSLAAASAAAAPRGPSGEGCLVLEVHSESEEAVVSAAPAPAQEQEQADEAKVAAGAGASTGPASEAADEGPGRWTAGTAATASTLGSAPDLQQQHLGGWCPVRHAMSSNLEVLAVRRAGAADVAARPFWKPAAAMVEEGCETVENGERDPLASDSKPRAASPPAAASLLPTSSDGVPMDPAFLPPRAAESDLPFGNLARSTINATRPASRSPERPAPSPTLGPTPARLAATSIPMAACATVAIVVAELSPFRGLTLPSRAATAAGSSCADAAGPPPSTSLGPLPALGARSSCSSSRSNDSHALGSQAAVETAEVGEQDGEEDEEGSDAWQDLITWDAAAPAPARVPLLTSPSAPDRLSPGLPGLLSFAASRRWLTKDFLRTHSLPSGSKGRTRPAGDAAVSVAIGPPVGNGAGADGAAGSGDDVGSSDTQPATPNRLGPGGLAAAQQTLRQLVSRLWLRDTRGGPSSSSRFHQHAPVDGPRLELQRSLERRLASVLEVEEPQSSTLSYDTVSGPQQEQEEQQPRHNYQHLQQAQQAQRQVGESHPEGSAAPQGARPCHPASTQQEPGLTPPTELRLPSMDTEPIQRPTSRPSSRPLLTPAAAPRQPQRLRQPFDALWCNLNSLAERTAAPRPAAPRASSCRYAETSTGACATVLSVLRQLYEPYELYGVRDEGLLEVPGEPETGSWSGSVPLWPRPSDDGAGEVWSAFGPRSSAASAATMAAAAAAASGIAAGASATTATATAFGGRGGAAAGGVEGAAGPGSRLAEHSVVLAFRGLRVRMGLHSGARPQEVAVVAKSGVTLMAYTGDFLATAKEVGDAAMGGMVVLSDTAFDVYQQQLLRQRGGGRESTSGISGAGPTAVSAPGNAGSRRDVMLLHLGEHVLKEPPQGPDGQQHLPPALTAKPAARDVYVAVRHRLAPRLALLPSPIRTAGELVPGCLSAPAGVVAPVFCNVVGVEALMAWEALLHKRLLRAAAQASAANLNHCRPYNSIIAPYLLDVPEVAGSTAAGAGGSAAGGEDQGLGMVRSALELFRGLAKARACALGGYVVASSSDSGHWVLVFGSPEAAVRWGLDMLEAMLEADWPEGFLEHELTEEVWEGGVLVQRGLRLRIGVDCGQAMIRLVPRTGRLDYVGRPMNRAARIAAKAKAASILVSGAVWEAVRPCLDAAVCATSLGRTQLKGVREQLELWSLRPRRTAAGPGDEAGV